MDIELLVKVTARRWSLAILALLHQGVPGRQAPLLTASGAGRTAFAQSLTHLVGLGLLERNPGHGHPLRPEFRLTAMGIEIAKLAADLTQKVPGDTDLALVQRSWTLPVLAVAQSPRRFSQIKGDLGGITDRALSKTLDQLQDRRWMTREVDVTARPPRPFYRAANLGLALSEAVRAA